MTRTFGMTVFSRSVAVLLVASLAGCVDSPLPGERRAYRRQQAELEQRQPVDLQALAESLSRSARLEERYGQYDEASRLHERLARVQVQRGETKLAVEALQAAASDALATQSVARSVACYAQADAVLAAAGIRDGALWVTVQRQLAFIHDLQGDAAKSAEHLRILAEARADSGGDPKADVIPVIRSEPDYPPAAAWQGIEGTVVVTLTINERGSVEDAHVIESQPPELFDQAALDAVRQWRYLPRLAGGKPVRRDGVEVKLEFRLER